MHYLAISNGDEVILCLDFHQIHLQDHVVVGTVACPFL